jgi:hypothetical protein
MSEKKWYRSKTKIGGILIGASIALGGMGYYLTGDMAATEATIQIVTGIGSILTITGIRDAIEEYFTK